MKLHFRRLGEGKPMVILHGLFGSSDNWQTLGKQLADEFEVYLVDQRNHGRSPHSNEFSYEAMAHDLYELFRDENLEDVTLIGHSMGGKTAMTFAQEFEGFLNKMVVVDMGVKKYPVHHAAILEGLQAVNSDGISVRKEVDQILTEFVPEFGVRQFLLKNLYWESPGKLGWRFNVPVIARDIKKMGEAVSDKQVNVNTLFLSGGKSDYVLPEDMNDIKSRFPNSDFEVIDQAGHWVHAEAPNEFIELLTNFTSLTES